MRLIFAILLFLPVTLWCDEVDSLLKESRHPKKERQVSAYIKLSKAFYVKDVGKSREYAERAINISKSLGNDSLLTASKTALGIWYHNNNKLDSANTVLVTLLREIDKNKNIDLYFEILNQLGVVFGKFGKYDIAMDYLNRASELSDLVKDKNLVTMLNNSIGNIAISIKDIPMAKDLFYKVVKDAKALNNKDLYKAGLSNLAYSHVLSGELDTARLMMQHNIAEFENRDENELTTDYINYALVLQKLGFLDSANVYYEKAIQESYKNNQVKHRLIAYLNRFTLYSFKNHPQHIVENMLNSILDTATIYNLLEIREHTALQMIKFYESIGEYKKTNKALRLLYDLKDSLGYMETQKEIAVLKATIEQKNYQDKIALQNLQIEKEKNKSYFYLILNILVVLITLILAVSFIWNRKLIKKLESQNNDIASKNTLLEENNRQMNIQKYQIESILEDLKSNKEVLERSNRQKDTFMSVFTHQLTNQVQAVLMSAEALHYGKNKPKEFTDKFSEIVFTASVHLRNMLVNLMEWLRTQNEYVSVNKEYFQLDEIIDRNLKAFDQVIVKKRIRLMRGCEEQAIHADKAMIDTVFKNILSNAVKYSNIEGVIDISCTEENGKIKVRISDNGIGITTEIKEKLFDIETRVSTRGTNGEYGTGLGLSICKELLTLNDGSIELLSEEDKGTEVIITLPALEEL